MHDSIVRIPLSHLRVHNSSMMIKQSVIRGTKPVELGRNGGGGTENKARGNQESKQKPTGKKMNEKLAPLPIRKLMQ